jgi:FKBP-type peptidyl-prolyl cis-trans isomerase FklB
MQNFPICLISLISQHNFNRINMSFEKQVDKFSYALGLSLASNLLQSGIKVVDYQNLFDAIEDVLEGRMPKLSADEANRVIDEYFQNRQASEGSKNLNEGQLFLEKNRENEEVVCLESGLQYQIITQGSGVKPQLSDQVKCHYHGTLIDGTIFDSSVRRNEPAVFPVSGVIAGWVEALQLMNTGSKWRLFIPPHLAYGENGAGGSIGPNSTLIFDVELLEIV